MRDTELHGHGGGERGAECERGDDRAGEYAGEHPCLQLRPQRDRQFVREHDHYDRYHAQSDESPRGYIPDLRESAEPRNDQPAGGFIELSTGARTRRAGTTTHRWSEYEISGKSDICFVRTARSRCRLAESMGVQCRRVVYVRAGEY